MTKKQRTVRIIVNSVLLVAIIALGFTVYQAGSEGKKQKELAQEQQAQLEAEQDKLAEQESAQAETEEEPLVDVGTSKVEAQMDSGEELAEAEGTEADISDESAAAEDVGGEQADTQAADAQVVEMSQEPAVSAIPEVNFTEETLMVWPLSGDILLDYDMEQTVYHPTLDQYKYSPAIAISAAVDSPVLAAANGTVTSIEENAETGTTVTVDMGNGYQAVYGQLKDIQVYQDQTIGESTIIGYVAEPTKYYSVEGSNLYFAMTQDGAPVDPIQYLP